MFTLQSLAAGASRGRIRRTARYGWRRFAVTQTT